MSPIDSHQAGRMLEAVAQVADCLLVVVYVAFIRTSLQAPQHDVVGGKRVCASFNLWHRLHGLG